MAVRVVNGSTFTEDGWPLVDQAGCTWVTVPGANPAVQVQVQSGIPATLLGSMWLGDWNAYIEPLENATTASWTEGNSVLGGYGQNNGSNHLGGTATDADWERHPMGPEAPDPAAGFSQAQYDEMQRMKAYYTFTAKDGRVIQLVWWANDWNSPHDSMHSQMGYYTYQYRDEVAAWITAHIRADGLSMYRRGAQSAGPSFAQIFANATGVTEALAAQLVPTMMAGLKAAECTNDNRIAMFFAMTGEESDGYNTTQEYASGAEYDITNNHDLAIELGNTTPGDGVKYKGRTWIQITGKGHYAAFSQWAFDQGLCTSPTQFVDDPASLADIEWAGIGAAWYWTVERPGINAMADAGDVVGVTKAVNGGTNGLADRQRRYTLALQQGDTLLQLITDTEEDDMAQVPQDEWGRVVTQLDRVFHEVADLRASRSRLRHLGEGTIDTWSGFGLNTDGSEHVDLVIKLAGYGDPGTLALLEEVATADAALYPDRQEDALLAQAILASLNGSAQPALTATASQGQILPAGMQYTPVQNVVYQSAPAQVLDTLTTPDQMTTGQLLGAAFDALAALQAAKAVLSPQAAASIESLITVLQTAIPEPVGAPE